MPAVLFAPAEPEKLARAQSPAPQQAAARGNLDRTGASWLAEFEATPESPSAPSLVGSRWSGTEHYSNGGTLPRYFDLLADGKIRYGDKPGSPAVEGSWRQRGDAVFIETNAHYAEWLFALQGEALVGKAHNKTGLTWTLTLERKR